MPETETGDKPAPDQKVRRSKMYFVEVLDDGSIQMKSIVRPVYYVDSPLTETIRITSYNVCYTKLLRGFPEQFFVCSEPGINYNQGKNQ